MDSDQETKQERVHGISVLEIIFVVAFLLLVGMIIYFLMNTLNTKEIITDVKGGNSLDQINAIMSATDNAINKIYNVLVVSTIFFTVLVASVSIFQFIEALTWFKNGKPRPLRFKLADQEPQSRSDSLNDQDL